MQIILMRHGEPEIDKHLRLNAVEFGAWVEKYNASGIDTEHLPPQVAIEQANQCTFAVCSNLQRSLESAKALGIERIGICDSMFREMDMPHASWLFPRISLLAWSVFFRLAWVFGYSENAESFKAAKVRAHRCTEHLAGLAATHGTVLFVGHGTLNWFIARHLKTMGWSGPKSAPRKYWEFGVYHYHAT